MVTDRYRTSIPLAQKEEYERFAGTFIPKAWRRNWLEKRSTAFTGEMPQESDIYVRTASKDLMMSSARYFPTLVYRYAPHTHLKRNILSDVCNGDRVADDLRPILRRKDRNYTVKQAWDE